MADSDADLLGDDETCHCPSCGEVLDILIAKQATIRDLERELRVRRATITRMRNDRDGQEAMHPLAEPGREVFEHWRAKLAPKAREFTGARFDAVVARLGAGASVEELKQAIDGIALFPYVGRGGRAAHGKATERQAELALICRSESHVQRYAAYAEPIVVKPPAKGVDLIAPDVVEAIRKQITPSVLDRLRELRGWAAPVVQALGLGLDAGRVTFPIHDASGTLVGLHRYQPNPEQRNGQPKMIAEGARDLFPAPETVTANNVWLVEGEPDAVALRSAGLPAVGVPGVQTWKDGWTERFARFETVYVCFDCDDPGRAAAEARVSAIGALTSAMIVDLDPKRDDGYDVTDFLRDHGEATAARLAARAVATGGSVAPLRQPSEPPFDRLCALLEAHDCRVQHRGPGHAMAQCPAHEDRTASLSLSRGDDGRVLLCCHTGCTADQIVTALGLTLAELFEATG